ncbi:hypothetical protein PS634_02654 [Pseudomonas fluorescens]|nr:hypothetical protein PS634_02654 [Pseudomonas fluorescens]
MLAVVQRLGGDVQIAAADQPALCVQYLRGVDISVTTLAQNTAGLAVVDHARSNPCAGLSVQRGALIVQRLGNGSLQGAAGGDAAAVGQAVGRQGHIARSVAAVVCVDARFDHGRVTQLAASGQSQCIAGSDVLPGCEITAGGHRQRGTGVHRPVDLCGVGPHVYRAARRHLHDVEVTVGIDLDITATGRQVSGEPDANARFGTDQPNGTGVHAAQGRAVDRQFRFAAAVVCQCRRVQGLCIDVVAAGDDVEALGVQFGVDLRAAGDDVELIDVVGIQAHAVNRDAATLNVEALQLTVGVQNRFAGGQRDLRRVDEPAAVATDAIRVGDNDAGRLPRHFCVTPELAGIGADHFVENRVGRCTTQVGVADDDPAQLGALGLVGRVVEDHALTVDVVLLELVVRQAAGIGRGNVDDGHAIAGLAQRGPRATDRDAFGLNQQRLPEQGIGQNQRKATLGHSPEMLALGQRRGRLTGEQSELVNVHVSDLETEKMKGWVTGRNPRGNRSAIHARSRRDVPGSGQRSPTRRHAGHG